MRINYPSSSYYISWGAVRTRLPDAGDVELIFAFLPFPFAFPFASSIQKNISQSGLNGETVMVGLSWSVDRLPCVAWTCARKSIILSDEAHKRRITNNVQERIII